MSKLPIETEEILEVDPADLMRDNPAALVVNTESYSGMERYFAPRRLEPPQVVRVATFSLTGKEAIRLFVVDGMTRTKFADDHRDVRLPDYPDFRFIPLKVRDVTQDVMRDEAVVPLNERQAEQAALTMLQYLRAVVPPTIVHSRIAPDRIATHLINGWNNMVGGDIAEKFSALAALSLLEEPRVPVATDAQLTRFLREQEELLSGETIAQRQRIENGLLDIASIMRSSRLLRQQLARAAYNLVASGAPSVGGDAVTEREVFGLLHTPLVNRKLASDVVQIGEREQVRMELGTKLTNAFRRFAASPDRDQVFQSLTQALEDGRLTLAQTEDVLNSDTPVQRFQELRAEFNRAQLHSQYTEAKKGHELTDLEEALLGKLGSKTFLTDADLQASSRAVNVAVATVNKALDVQQSVQSTKDALIARGVDPRTIEEALAAISSGLVDLSEAYSPQTVNTRASKLEGVIKQFNDRSEAELTRYKGEQLVGQVWSGSSQIPAGLIVNYLAREGIDLGNEVVVRNRVTQLQGLDSDLQLQVVNGSRRLAAALSEHNRRRISPVEISTQPRGGSDVSTQLKRTPETPATLEVVPVNRVETGVKTLKMAVSTFLRALRDVDLDLSELPMTVKDLLDEALRIQGKLRFDHPDIVRLLEKDHPKLVAELRALRQAQIQKDQEESVQATKTGR